MAFNLDKFIEDCKSVNQIYDSQGAIRELMLQSISEPAAVVA